MLKRLLHFLMQRLQFLTFISANHFLYFCTFLGEYSCLQVDLMFARQLSFFVVTIYVPCSMTVTVSWFSFWLDHKAVSALFSLAGGELSCFSLVRGTQYVLCSMTVTVSWFSFWLDHKAVSARPSLAAGAISCFSLARGTQSTFPAP